MIAVFVLILFHCASAQDILVPVRFSESKKMTPEQFRKISDDPFTDPVDDIPPVPSDRLQPQARDMPHVDDRDLSVPRDKYLRGDQKSIKPISQEESERRAHMWIDFEKIHDHVIQQQAKPRATTRKPNPNLAKLGKRVRTSVAPKFNKKIYEEKLNEFEPNTFGLRSEDMLQHTDPASKVLSIVWTTCDEFKNPSRPYDPIDVVDFDWIPFYSWSPNYQNAQMHRFKIPTKKQVYEYHTKYSQYMSRIVDWNKPKLHFELDLGEREAMLIAADNTGLYYVIWNTPISEFMQRNKLTLQTLTLRLKLVGDYLALMYCNEKSARIMARDGHLPETNKAKREAAKILKFKGKGRAVLRNLEFEKQRAKLKQDQIDYLKEIGVGFTGQAAGDRPIGWSRKTKGKVVDPTYERLIPGGSVAFA